MTEQNRNLWAPWRMEYIRSLTGDDEPEGCFLCRYWGSPEDDEVNHVVLRAEHAFATMNRFPYTNGHLLISPAEHCGELASLRPTSFDAMNVLTRDVLRLLTQSLGPHGFNVGINQGRCAGAGLPDHIHTHIVPRWNGDTNYMAVVGDVHVVPQALSALFEQLTADAKRMGLPG